MKKIILGILIVALLMVGCEDDCGDRCKIEEVELSQEEEKLNELEDLYLSLKANISYSQVLDLVKEYDLMVEEDYFGNKLSGNLIITKEKKEKGLAADSYDNIHISFRDRNKPEVITGDAENYIIETAIYREKEAPFASLIFDPRRKILSEGNYLMCDEYYYFIETTDKIIENTERNALEIKDIEGNIKESEILAFKSARIQLEFYKKMKKWDNM